MFKFPKSFLTSLATAKQLSDGEREVFYRITEEQSIDNIAKELETSTAAIYQRLAQIYSKFEIEGKGPGKLSKLQIILISKYENSHSFEKSQHIEENIQLPSQSSFIIKPDTSNIFSREYQPSDWLKTLNSEIDSDKDINSILSEFPDYFSAALDYLTSSLSFKQKKIIYKTIFSQMEKSFIESEKKKNYVPAAEKMKVWHKDSASSPKETPSIISTQLYNNHIPYVNTSK